MDADRIQEILQEADEAAGEPKLTTDLSDRTYRIYGHRRRITVGLSTAAGLILVAGIIYLGRGILFSSQPTASRQEVVVNRDKPRQLAQAEIEQLRAEVARLRAEAELRTAILVEVLKRQDRQERQDKLRVLERQVRMRSDPMAEVNRLVERAALVTLYQADRKYNELDLKESAIADYRQVIKYYPETRWAKQARQRLAEIETQENPSEQGDVL